jgi:hypothetical protein
MLRPLAALVFSSVCASAQTPGAGPDFTVALPNSGVLVGTVQNATPLNWWTADGNQSTENCVLMFHEGLATQVSPILHSPTGQIFGWPSDLVPIGSAIYGIESFHRYLYTLDVASGLCAPIGAQNPWADVYSLAYDAAGDRLFGVDLLKKQLLRFDRQTGAVAKVGAGSLVGYSLIRGLAFRDSDGMLYAADESTNKILRVDPATGVPTVALQLPSDPYSRVEELAFAGDCLYASLGLQDASGTLIAGRLQRIDLASGEVTNIGPILDQCSPHALVIQSLPEETVWTQIGGPFPARIAKPHSLQSRVRFGQPGLYSFSLTAFTASGPVVDTVDVLVTQP